MSKPIDGEADHRALVNAEGQYSIWPAFREAPAGWTAVGPTSTRENCLAWIDSQWIDMRPKSLRDAELRSGR